MRAQVRTAGTLQIIEDIPQYADEAEESSQQLLFKGGESSSRSSANSPEPDNQPAGRVRANVCVCVCVCVCVLMFV